MEGLLVEGMHTYYYPETGTRMSNGLTRNGQKIGIWIYFNLDGSVLLSRKEFPGIGPAPGTPAYMFIHSNEIAVKYYYDSDDNI